MPKLDAYMAHVSSGDELVVADMQSLSREIVKMAETIKTLKPNGAKLVVMEGSFDLMRSDGEFGLTLMAAQSQLEVALEEEANAQG